MVEQTIQHEAMLCAVVGKYLPTEKMFVAFGVACRYERKRREELFCFGFVLRAERRLVSYAYTGELGNDLYILPLQITMKQLGKTLTCG